MAMSRFPILFNLNKNMKYLLFISAWFGLSVANGQDLRQFVPSDAIFVGSVNGSNILETVTISEFDQSKLGQKMLRDFSNQAGFEIASINDFGINANAHTYFYHSSNDSLSYTTLVAPLKNTSALELARLVTWELTSAVRPATVSACMRSGCSVTCWAADQLAPAQAPRPCARSGPWRRSWGAATLGSDGPVARLLYGL